MSEQQTGPPAPTWADFELPELLLTDSVRELHATIEKEWDSLQRSACQTAAGRALWKHVIHDPLADLLAGETYLRSLHDKIKRDCTNNASEISGVILAVRTLWFDSKLDDALRSLHSANGTQVVLLGAGMDARAYRLSCLGESDVFEVDLPQVLLMKATLLQAAITESTANGCQHAKVMAKSLTRVAADIKGNDWLERLEISGYMPAKNTVWILEGILYYLTHSQAMQVLKSISDKCSLATTFLLADFINRPSAATPSDSSAFQFCSNWPDQLLPSLGFSHVQLSQIGDEDADFGLFHNPSNLFSKLRSLPRSLETQPDGTPCSRLYLVRASGSPDRVVEPAHLS